MYPTRKLSEVWTITTGFTPSKNNPEFWGGKTLFIKPPHLQTDKIVTETEETLSDLGREKWKLLKKNSIMVCCIGSLGKIGIAGENVCTNQQINSVYFDPGLVLFKYWYYFCTTLEATLKQLANKAVVQIINKSTFSKIPIPLPPLATQQRIVAKLDEAFANIDRQIALLRENIADTENIGKSALEESFASGDFEMKKLGEVVNFLSGWTPSKDNKSFWVGSIPWISPKDMKRMKLDSATDYVSEEAVTSSATKLLPINSLLCVTRSGILVHSFPVAINIVPVAFNQDIRAIIPSKKLDSEYLYYAIKAKEREILSNWIKKWPTVHSIISGYLDNLLIPLPTLPRQREIVAHLDSVFASTRALRGWYEAQILSLESLKQSLLHDAFEGRLVTD